MTKKQAIEFYNSKKWQKMSDVEKVTTQLNESRLCMPRDVFIDAAEKVLGRPVMNTESNTKLLKEFKRKIQ